MKHLINEKLLQDTIKQNQDDRDQDPDFSDSSYNFITEGEIDEWNYSFCYEHAEHLKFEDSSIMDTSGLELDEISEEMNRPGQNIIHAVPAPFKRKSTT